MNVLFVTFDASSAARRPISGVTMGLAILVAAVAMVGCEGLTADLDDITWSEVENDENNDTNNDPGNNTNNDADECDDDTGCSTGKHCTEGECVDPCDTADCDGSGQCYHGECFDVCEEQLDCGEDARCFEGSCLPRECDDVEYCPDGMECHQGGCYVPCEDEGDCEAGQSCHKGEVCLTPSCEDGLVTGDQSDVDCGGSECGPCGDEQSCNEDADCQDNLCSSEGQCLDCNPQAVPMDVREDYGKVLLCAPEHFAQLPERPEFRDNDFLLMDDIDMDGVVFDASGEPDAFEPYTGSFDGMGHAVENLMIEVQVGDSAPAIGVFNMVEGATIRDVTFESLEVTAQLEYQAGDGATPLSVGGVVGAALDSALKGIRVKDATITGGEVTGGMVGWIVESTVEKSMADAEIVAPLDAGGLFGINREASVKEVYATGSVKGEDNVGGLSGSDEQGEYEDCYTLVDVDSPDEADQVATGGLAGSAEATDVDRCYAAGDVSDSGGLFAQAWSGDEAPTVNRSYFDEDRISVLNDLPDDQVYGEGMVGEQFQSEDSFEDWDFSEVWEIMNVADGALRPHLQWDEQ